MSTWPAFKLPASGKESYSTLENGKDKKVHTIGIIATSTMPFTIKGQQTGPRTTHIGSHEFCCQILESLKVSKFCIRLTL